MSKLIAIASSDWHIHKFPEFNEGNSRVKQGIKAGDYILSVAKEAGVPHLFAGDILHNAKEVENETLTMLISLLSNHTAVTTFAISGNHDMSEKNTLAHSSPSYLDALGLTNSRIIKIDNTRVATKKMAVYGIPFMNSDKELVKAIKGIIKGPDEGKTKILMLHGTPANCKSTTGYTLESDFPEDMDKLFKYWDLVLWGHIHRPQELGKKSIMIGSPIQQNFGDEGVDMGYWEIYEGGKAKFISLCGKFPCFYRGTETEISYGDAGGMIRIGFDYIQYVEETQEEPEEAKVEFDISQSKKQLAKQYCKKKGIKDKKKIRGLIEILNSI